MERLKRQTNRLQEIKISTNNRYTEMKRTIFPYDFLHTIPLEFSHAPCMWMWQIVFMTE